MTFYDLNEKSFSEFSFVIYKETFVILFYNTSDHKFGSKILQHQFSYEEIQPAMLCENQIVYYISNLPI